MEIPKYKHILLFDYFGHTEEVIVDDFFVFGVKYFNKYSSRNLVKQSEKMIVPLGVTEIHLYNRNGRDCLVYKWNGKFIDMTDDIGLFLKIQYSSVSLKMLFYAIKENCDGMTTSMRLIDIAENYEHVVF